MKVFIDEIEKRAFEICDKFGIMHPSHREMFACGYRYGLRANPWHKASEELPKVDKYRKCIKVFARKGDDVFVAFYSVVAGFSLSSSFYTEYALSGVTHWMEIPEIKED